MLIVGNCFSANLKIKLSHQFVNEQIILNEKTYKTANNEEVTFSRLKYYIGNIVLNYNDGKSFTDVVRYHLIDQEQSESLILELKDIPEGTITNLEFSIGVDSLTNANGLMDGDLDPLKGMYWAWSSGFINFKLEGECLNCKTAKEFTYHIGGFIAPYESIQVYKTNLEKEITSQNLEIEMVVDINNLFKAQNIDSLNNIMSPSEKSKSFSKKLTSIFSIKL